MSASSEVLLALFLALAMHCASSVCLRGGPPQRSIGANSTAGHLASATRPQENISFQAARLQPQCQCVANDPTWFKTPRTIPKCIFIDLGAANGNSFQAFLQDHYGDVLTCPSGQWEAFLVEANPKFDEPLKLLESQYPGQVHSLASTAAYTCNGQTNFYIDTDKSHNYWGWDHQLRPSVTSDVHSRGVRVTVPATNVIQMIAENTIPGDWVMLKVDIEGAEYELIPCLAQYNGATLVDRIYLEQHTWYGDSQRTPYHMEEAKAKLKWMGVEIPDYSSNSL